jgi:hypothetical protein
MGDVIDIGTRRKRTATKEAKRAGWHKWKVFDYHPDCRATSWECTACGLLVLIGSYQPDESKPDRKPRLGQQVYVDGLTTKLTECAAREQCGSAPGS